MVSKGATSGPIDPSSLYWLSAEQGLVLLRRYFVHTEPTPTLELPVQYFERSVHDRDYLRDYMYILEAPVAMESH